MTSEEIQKADDAVLGERQAILVHRMNCHEDAGWGTHEQFLAWQIEGDEIESERSQRRGWRENNKETTTDGTA